MKIPSGTYLEYIDGSLTKDIVNCPVMVPYTSPFKTVLLLEFLPDTRDKIEYTLLEHFPRMTNGTIKAFRREIENLNDDIECLTIGLRN